MTAVATSIEDKIATIMVASNALNSLNAVIRGLAYRVPLQYWPYAEVMITDEITEKEFTGNRHQRAYSGMVFVRVKYPDTVAIVSRTARVQSFADVATLVDAIVVLFKTASNQSLQNLTVNNGAVERIAIGDQQITYGISEPPGYERTNTYANEGTVPFTVWTTEDIA